MKIVDKKTLVQTEYLRITQIQVDASRIAQKALPGQFVVVIPDEYGERIPLTIVDADVEGGTITLIFQEAGYTTKRLGQLNVADTIYSLSGPLGVPTEMKHYGNVIVVGGGVGIAEIFPVARGFKEAANQVATIIGARTKEALILKNELTAVSDHCYVATDDGSVGEKGFVTDILSRLMTQGRPQLVYAVGPIPMMRKVAEITTEPAIQTMVSLNTLMVDATGMCGCCRVTVGKEVKFACIDGPEFDAHSVDWDELINRSRMYEKKEKHICHLKREEFPR